MASTDSLYTLSPDQVIFYGVVWCADCRRARRVFSQLAVNYVDIDVEQDEKAAEFVRSLNNGFQSVPTIIFPDGSRLTEPDGLTLTQKLETLKQTA